MDDLVGHCKGGSRIFEKGRGTKNWDRFVDTVTHSTVLTLTLDGFNRLAMKLSPRPF